MEKRLGVDWKKVRWPWLQRGTSETKERSGRGSILVI